MTDRELLELAAKAAGVDVRDVRATYEPWDPLSNDGEAFQLMVTLGLEVGVHNFIDVRKMGSLEYVTEPAGDNPANATRRAIVRCAAEIGRTK